MREAGSQWGHARSSAGMHLSTFQEIRQWHLTIREHPAQAERQTAASLQWIRSASAKSPARAGVLRMKFGASEFAVPVLVIAKADEWRASLTTQAANVMGALMKAGYMSVVSSAEVLVAVMLLTNRFVPLALALL